MRRPRRRLEVSTFPFLAVLLCAMGSLILLLLVLDRRAKAAARGRAQEVARQALAERGAAARAAAEAAARRTEERAAERERQRTALHEQLARARDEVTAQRKSVEGRKSDVARGTAAQAERWRELLEVLGSRREELANAERETATSRTTAAEAGEMSESARKEAARLSARLRGLEVVLDELKASRKRDAQTYSLMPYRGKRGDGRRPLYVECGPDGIVFHPDRKTLTRIATALEIRNEVDARVERQRQAVLAQGGQPEKRAYLLMLVRPNGIGTYYATLGALKGKEIDFGYEFIDADWVLDFPEDGAAPAAQPWMTAQRLPVAPADPSAPTRKVTGLRAGKVPGGGDDFAEGGVEGAGTGSGSGPGRGGLSDLPPLPGAGTGSPGQTGGRAMPGGSAPGVAWSSVGSGMGGATGGSDLPPLPGAPMGGGAGGSVSGRPPGGPGIPGGVSLGASGSGRPGVPNTDGALPGHPPPTPGGGGGTGQAGGTPGVQGIAGETARIPGTGGGAGSGPPALFPFDRATQPRGGSGGPSGGGANVGEKGDGNPGNGQPRSTTGGGQPSAGGGSPGGGESGGAGASGQSGGSPTDGSTGEPGSTPAKGARSGAAADEAPGAGPPRGATSGGPSALGGGGTPVPTGTARGGQPQDPDEPQGPNLGAGLLPGGEKRPAPQPPRPLRLIGNRDWVIPVECRADSVVLRNAGQKFAPPNTGGDNPLLHSLRQTIARRQATVRPGEPPYRPQVRFLIYPDGLKTYYLTLSALEPLGIPLTRQNVEADPSPRPAP